LNYQFYGLKNELLCHEGKIMTTKIKNMDKEILFFIEKVKDKIGKNLIKILLYGSRARGDYWDGSDYDFIVILQKKDSEAYKLIQNIEIDFLNTFDALSSCLVFNENEWEERKQLPLGINVRREGITL
jgi:predicted nucleotidyltransferase